MSLIVSCTHSPLDITSMLRQRNIPCVRGANNSKGDKCVFLFVSSNMLQSSNLSGKEGVMILLDNSVEISRWKDSIMLSPSVSPAELETELAYAYGKLKKPVRLEREDVILTALDTSDIGMMKDIMSFLYTIKKHDVREKVKHDIFSWLVSDKKPESLINSVLGNLPKQTTASSNILIEFEQCINSVNITNLRKAFASVNTGVSIDDAASEFCIETFEMNYIKKFLSVK